MEDAISQFLVQRALRVVVAPLPAVPQAAAGAAALAPGEPAASPTGADAVIFELVVFGSAVKKTDPVQKTAIQQALLPARGRPGPGKLAAGGGAFPRKARRSRLEGGAFVVPPAQQPRPGRPHQQSCSLAMVKTWIREHRRNLEKRVCFGNLASHRLRSHAGIQGS